MADRTPAFLDGTDGSPEDFDPADISKVGGVKVTTSAGVDAGGFAVKNVLDPVNPQDAVTLAFHNANPSEFDVDVIATTVAGFVVIDNDGNVVRSG